MPQYDYNIPKDRAANMGWVLMGPLMILCHQAGEVAEDRLEECLNTVKEHDPAYILSVGQGAAKIDSVQRKRSFEIFKGRKICGLFDNAITRGIMTAMGWLGLTIKGFSSADLDKAIDYLNVPDLVPLEIIGVVARLRELTVFRDTSGE